MVADIIGLEIAMLDQDLTDGDVGLVVLAVVTHAQGLAVGQQDAAGTLDLQHEGINRVGKIGGDWRLAVERAVIDGLARQVGEGGGGGFGVERHGVAAAVIFGAGILRLEIASDEGWAGNGIDGEICLEKLLGGCVAAGRDSFGGGAGGLPKAGLAGIFLRQGHVLAAKFLVCWHAQDILAAEYEGGQGRGGVVLLPAGQRGEGDLPAGRGAGQVK